MTNSRINWRDHAWDQRTMEWLVRQIDASNFVQVHSLIGEALYSPDASGLAGEDWWAQLVQATPATSIDLTERPPRVSFTAHLIRELRRDFHRGDIHKVRLSSLATVMSQRAAIAEEDWLTGYITELNQPIAGGDLDMTQISADTWEALTNISLNPHLARLSIPAYPGSLLTPYRLLATEALKANLRSEYQSSVAVNLAANLGASSEDLAWYMDILEEEVPRSQGEFEDPTGLGVFLSRILAAFNSNPNYAPHYAVESIRESQPWVLEEGALETGWKSALAIALKKRKDAQKRNSDMAVDVNQKETWVDASLHDALRHERNYRLVRAVRYSMHAIEKDRGEVDELYFVAKFAPLIGIVFSHLEEELGLEPGSVPTPWLAELL